MIIAGNVAELVSNALTVSRLKYDCVAAVGDLCPVCISAQDGRCFRCCVANVTSTSYRRTLTQPRRSFYAPSPHRFLQPADRSTRTKDERKLVKKLSLSRYSDTTRDDLAALGTHSLSFFRGAKRSWLCKTSRRCVSVGRARRILPLQWFTTLYRPRSHVETTPATRYTLFCVP